MSEETPTCELVVEPQPDSTASVDVTESVETEEPPPPTPPPPVLEEQKEEPKEDELLVLETDINIETKIEMFTSPLHETPSAVLIPLEHPELEPEAPKEEPVKVEIEMAVITKEKKILRPRKLSKILKNEKKKVSRKQKIKNEGNEEEKSSQVKQRRNPPVLTPVRDIKAIIIPESLPPKLLAEEEAAPVDHIVTESRSSSRSSSSRKTKKRFGRNKKKFEKLESRSTEITGECESDFTGSTIDGEVSRSCSPGAVDVIYTRKRKALEEAEENAKRCREQGVSSPALADSTLKAATPESTSTNILCLCQKLPQIYVNVNNNPGDLCCQALDSIDNRVLGCCNVLDAEDIAMYRPSTKVSYKMLCQAHQQRLQRHNCCPGCGLFCTQGKFLQCRSNHLYHPFCQIEDNDCFMCPHCGDDKPPRSLIVTLRSQKMNPIFLPQQKPPRLSKTAKMSITRGAAFPLLEEEPPILLPAEITKDCITPGGLPQCLDRDKLAQMLNVAIKCFRELACTNRCPPTFRYSFKTLFNAAKSGDVDRLLKTLACGLNPNHMFEDNNKRTVLHIAAAHGHLPLIHILLQAGSQIDVVDTELHTPLTLAITLKQNDVVKYLIKCGASLIMKGEDGMTPLHIAARLGNLHACHYLLHAVKLPPRYIDGMDDGGWTPLVWASEFNHMDIVRYLLNKGADPFLRDIEQNIALHWATYGGSVDIVDFYLSHGSPINAVNAHGDSPLHIAARQNKYNCVLLLLARGARSDIVNKAGETAKECSESPESDIYKGIALNQEMSSLLTKFHEKTPKILSNDISKGKERNQIQCLNAVDDAPEPKDYLYITENCFTSNISIDRTITSLHSCRCENHCNKVGETCSCATSSIQCWYDAESKLTPDFCYTDPPMIFECNPACTCNRITCINRVVQNGVTCRFQLFRTNGRGWGVKTVNAIPKGTYVCEYIGEIISDCEADHREDDSYLFDLDNRDGETYCIDARRYGNISRFINHMCAPNLMPVHIFIEHQDLHFPRIAFFANRDIQADEELGYDYGAKFWIIKYKSFTCTCGADKCFYSDKTIKVTLENYNKKLEEIQ